MNNINSSRFFYFIISILIAGISAGCQKSPVNGDLDGQWQVMSVEPVPSESVIEGRLYYCLSLHTCQLSTYGGVWITGNMSFSGKTLTLHFPDAESYQSSNDALRQYGISSNPVTFSVDHLDKKKMILKSGDTTVTLRKF